MPAHDERAPATSSTSTGREVTKEKEELLSIQELILGWWRSVEEKLDSSWQDLPADIDAAKRKRDIALRARRAHLSHAAAARRQEEISTASRLREALRVEMEQEAEKASLQTRKAGIEHRFRIQTWMTTVGRDIAQIGIHHTLSQVADCRSEPPEIQERVLRRLWSRVQLAQQHFQDLAADSAEAETRFTAQMAAEQEKSRARVGQLKSNSEAIGKELRLRLQDLKVQELTLEEEDLELQRIEETYLKEVADLESRLQTPDLRETLRGIGIDIHLAGINISDVERKLAKLSQHGVPGLEEFLVAVQNLSEMLHMSQDPLWRPEALRSPRSRGRRRSRERRQRSWSRHRSRSRARRRGDRW